VSLTFANSDSATYTLVTLAPTRNVTFHPLQYVGRCFNNPVEQGGQGQMMIYQLERDRVYRNGEEFRHDHIDFTLTTWIEYFHERKG
jgi:hypothetical protein